MRRSKTFEYNYFKPGTLVTPTSRQCPLEAERIYKVCRCSEPMFIGDEAICFVEGHETSVSTEHLRAVTKKLPKQLEHHIRRAHARHPAISTKIKPA